VKRAHLLILSVLVLCGLGLVALMMPNADYATLPPQAPGTPVFISTGDSEAGQDNGVAFDATGLAVAVWEETGKVLTRRYVSKFDGKSNAEGWGATTEIVIPPKTEPVASNVVSFAPKHMLAFWTARDSRQDVPGGWPYALWSASYTKGQWSAAIPVSKAMPAGQTPASQVPTGVSTNHERLSVAAGKDAASGKAIAVWQEWWCTGECITSVKLSRIMSATYNAENGWSTPIQVSDNSTPIPEEPEVSIDQQGRAIAVWLQPYEENGAKALVKEEGLRIRRLYFSVLQPGSVRWTLPQLVEGIDATADVSKAVVSSNAAGKVVIAWVQKKGRKDSDRQANCEVVTATRSLAYELPKSEASRLAWEESKSLSRVSAEDDCQIYDLQAAVDTAGNALVGWTAHSRPDVDHVAYAPAGQPWQAQLALPYSEGGSMTQLRMAFTSSGRAVVVGTYSKHDQERSSKRTHIVTHQFDAGKMDAKNPSKAWTNSQRIDWLNGASAQQPTLAVHPNGQAISSWRQMIPGKAGISAYIWDTNTGKSP
jgi:hypothetical protein